MGRFVDQFFIQMTGPENLILDRDLNSAGKSPVLVLLHGIMGYAMNWRRVAKEFESAMPVLAYDSRGHGRSQHADLTRFPQAYAPKNLAEDLRKILDDLKIDQVILVGHSMGGRVAYTFASLHPERVQALVIEDIGPEPTPEVPLSLRILDAVPVPFVDKRAAKKWFETEFQNLFSTESVADGGVDVNGLAAWLYANITDADSDDESNSSHEGRAFWRFDINGIRAAISESRESSVVQEGWACLKSLTMPTLLIRGENSKELLKQDFDKIKAINANIVGVEIPGAGHWVHSQQFEGFMRELKAFLGPFISPNVR